MEYIDILRLVILAIAIFLMWFGYTVESGIARPNPSDQFFPFFGKNVDYIIGTSVILIGLGLILIIIDKQNILLGIMICILGIIRAFTPYTPLVGRIRNQLIIELLNIC